MALGSGKHHAPTSSAGSDHSSPSGSLVAEIAHRLDISVGNRALVKDVMLECLEQGSHYDVASPLPNCGRHALIEELSVEANIIYKQLEHVISILQATVRLNQFRETLTPPAGPLSWSCGYKVA